MCDIGDHKISLAILSLLLFLLLLVFGIVTGIQALAERPPEFFRFEWSKKNTVRVEEKANTVSEFFQNLFRKKNVEPDSDKDSDGFTFEQEGVFRTNPNDPLSHPKYISMVRVSSIIKGDIPGVELISVDPSSVQKNKWYATFRLSDDPSDVKMLFPGDSFQVGNDTFRLVDLESGTTAERSVAYIQRAGSDNRIPCSVGSPVWFKQMEVDLIDTLTGKTIPTSLNATFKLGSARTGEEEYKVVDFQSQQNQVTVAAVRNNPDSICWTITDQAASSFKDQQLAEAAASQKKISAAGVHVDAERKTNATLAFSLLKSANIPTGSCIYFAIAKDHRHLDFAKEDEDGRLVTVGETDGTNFPYALLVSPKNTPQSAKPEETIVFYEDPMEFFDGVLIAFANGNIEYLEGNFWTHADVMKAAARTFEFSAGTAAELQRKVTAFDGTATPETEKPAGSSANTPKHITQITVSDISNFMEVKLIEADTSKRNKKDWIATFLINGVSRIKVPYGAAFSFNNARFELTDIETDKATGAPVASIQTPGKDVHDCPLNEERRFVVQKYIMLFNKQNSTYLFPVIGATFKLGTAMTGEETYKVISADTRTKEVIVESVSDSGHEKFALLPE